MRTSRYRLQRGHGDPVVERDRPGPAAGVRRGHGERPRTARRVSDGCGDGLPGGVRRLVKRDVPQHRRAHQAVAVNVATVPPAGEVSVQVRLPVSAAVTEAGSGTTVVKVTDSFPVWVVVLSVAVPVNVVVCADVPGVQVTVAVMTCPGE